MRNDYRVGRRQVSFVCDVGLWELVRGVAVAEGRSVTSVIVGLLEGLVGGGGSSSGGVDWDAILLAGVKPAGRVGVVCVVDPLEEIA